MHGRPRQRPGQAPSPLHHQEQAYAVELQKLMPQFLQSNRTCWYQIFSPGRSANLLCDVCRSGGVMGYVNGRVDEGLGFLMLGLYVVTQRRR